MNEFLRCLEDYLKTYMLNHRLEVILRDAERLGIRDKNDFLVSYSIRYSYIGWNGKNLMISRRTPI